MTRVQASCTSLVYFKGSKYLAETSFKDWNWNRRSWDTGIVHIKPSLSEAAAYNSAMHEMGHVKTYQATEANRLRAYRAIANRTGGGYYNSPDEVIAQAYAVYAGKASWGKYRSITRAQFNQVRSYLG